PRHPSRKSTAHQERLEARRRTQARPRRQMAAQSVRSRRNTHRIHGVHSEGETLLLRIHRPASEPMNCPFSRTRFPCPRKLCSVLCALIGCCAGAAPLGSNARRLRSGWLFGGAGFSFPFRSSLRTLCPFLCALCVNSFFSFSVSSQDLDKPLQSIDEEVTAF